MTTPLERLQSGYYNSDPVSPTNPGGFADGGHVVNFPQALAELATVAGGVVLDAEAIGEAGAKAAAAAASADTASRAAGEAQADAGRSETAAEEAGHVLAQVAAAADVASEAAGRSSTSAEAAAQDRQAVGVAAEAVLQDRQRAEAAAGASQAAKTAAGDYRDEVEQLRDEAQDYRDQTEALANGAGLTLAQADGRYRKLDEKIAPADIEGLQAALDARITDEDLAEALSTFGGGSRPWTAQSETYVAADGDRVLADTSAAAWSLTLPVDGVVQVRDAAGTWSTHPLTIVGPIRGCTGDLICDQAAALELVRPVGAAAWIVSKFEGVAA